ncbi:MAG: TIGR03617 family F420-dependent LLM class oxidoreductase [Halieaceae bacterium]|nr:TIGR03617 family F420-dependent LLM class oxidoreductase [Halieaceae bacterium]
MRIEATITASSSIAELAQHGRELEEAGYDTILTPEAGHDPYLPQMILAEHTHKASIGTGVAIAFPRSPFVTAQMAWDLQRFSGGRFILGLSTQVKGHNERRYSTPWPSPPGPRLKEYILCLRAIFENFKTGEPPCFSGEFYQFTLNTPFFNPGPIEGVSEVPIYVGAVNKYNCRTAGEVADGIRLHPLNSPSYINEVVRPEVEKGAQKAGRAISDIDICANPFIITGTNEQEFDYSRELIRKHLSMYAATHAYRAVMEHHGWGEICDELVALSRAQRWENMYALVSDEMLDTFAVVAMRDELPARLEERYSGIITSANVVFGPPYPELQERQRQMFCSLAPVMDALKAVK